MAKRGLSGSESESKRSRKEAIGTRRIGSFDTSRIASRVRGDIDWTGISKPYEDAVKQTERDLWELKLWSEDNTERFLSDSCWTTVPRSLGDTRQKWFNISRTYDGEVGVLVKELTNYSKSRRGVKVKVKSTGFTEFSKDSKTFTYCSSPNSALVADDTNAEFFYIHNDDTASIKFEVPKIEHVRHDDSSICDELACFARGDSVYIVTSFGSGTVCSAPKPASWGSLHDAQRIIWARSVVDGGLGDSVAFEHR